MKVILFFILCILFLSVDGFAQLRPAQSQYLQQTGALINPSFEQGYKGWTITGDCTKSLVSDIPYLNKTLKLACVNQSFTVKQNTDLSAFVDQQALLTAQVKANIGGMSVNSLTNDVISTTASVIAGDYKSINIPVKVGDTSNGVEFSATSVTGEFFIDEVSLRLAPDLSYQVGQAQFVGKAYFADADCNWERVASTYGGLTTATTNCEATEVIGNITVPSPANNPFITITNFRTDGYYKVSYEGLLYNDGNAATCYFQLTKTTGVKSNNGEIHVPIEARSDNFITGDFRFEQGDTGNISIQAYNSSGTECSVRGQDNLNGHWSVYFYPDSNSTIVAQDTELTAKTANQFNAIIDLSGNVSNENYDWIDGNCTVVSTGVYDCDLISGLFTERLNCLATPRARSTQASYAYNNSTNILAQFATANSSGTASNQDFNVQCETTGADVNKNQTIIGKFEQIDSTPLCQVIAVDNDGDVLTADTEDIPFKTELKDNCNAWSNVGNTGSNTNDAFTAQKNGMVSVSINSAATTSSATALDIYEDNVFLYRCSVHTDGSNQKGFSCMFEAIKDSVYTFRFNNSFTLATPSPKSHIITITELPDTASIVENLNQNPRVSLQDQYSESEIEWGLWNGQQLYRRCFTVASDITSTGTTTLASWDSGLNPKNIPNYNGNLWMLDVITEEGSSTRKIEIYYNDSTGSVTFNLSATPWKLGAGTSFCMDYTK